jgi:hypothetical protein
MTTRIITVSCSLLLVACATTGVPATAKSANHAIEHALNAHEEAVAVGYEWRDTDSLIADAQKAVAAAQFDKATELAGQAERQSLAALKQYKSQKDAASIYD